MCFQIYCRCFTALREDAEIDMVDSSNWHRENPCSVVVPTTARVPADDVKDDGSISRGFEILWWVGDETYISDTLFF